MSQLTKKLKGKRVMRSLPVWKCLNKTTPSSWFDKYDRFFCELAYDLGFVSVTTSEVKKIGSGLHMTIEIAHSSGKVFSFTLLRAVKFAGGGIIFDQRSDKTSMLMSVSYNQDGSMYESRTEIGNWVIEQIREHWDLSSS